MSNVESLYSYRTNNYSDVEDTLKLLEDGQIFVETYSYEIDSTGELCLSKEESYKLYKALEKVFKERDH